MAAVLLYQEIGCNPPIKECETFLHTGIRGCRELTEEGKSRPGCVRK
jgi:hypothetical protein